MNQALLTASRFLAAQANPLAPTSADIVGLVFLGLFVLAFAFMATKFLAVKKKERLETLERLSEEAAREAQETAALKELEAPQTQVVPEPQVDAAPEPQPVAVATETAPAEIEPTAAPAVDAQTEPVPEPAPAPAVAADSSPEVAPPPKKSLFAALSSTRAGFVGRLSQILTGRGTIDEETLEELEAALFSADIGTQTADRLLESVRTNLKNQDLSSVAGVTAGLKKEIETIFAGVDSKPLAVHGEQPAVVMVVGVNGAGKTTSIGKLTHQLQNEGKKVVLGAGDTFRAAAVEQLEIWGERNSVPVVKGNEGADPSSVLFDAVERAKQESADVVLCDTAGRLHTKTNLMEELKKVHRVLGKAREGAPHEVLLVLDATTGQNAIAQAKQFSAAVPLTGIVLTKLDGTAKGGVVIGITEELQVPVRYIGVGEKIEDLRPFDAPAFVDALFDEASA